jgi:hypothetical protein
MVELGIRLLSDMMKEIEPDERKIRKSDYWVYQPESLTLYNQECCYEVDLETMTSSAKVLDWILQIAGKRQDDPAWDFRGFINVLQDVFWHRFGNTIQGVCCPFGQNMRINWRRKTYGRF